MTALKVGYYLLRETVARILMKIEEMHRCINTYSIYYYKANFVLVLQSRTTVLCCRSTRWNFTVCTSLVSQIWACPPQDRELSGTSLRVVEAAFSVSRHRLQPMCECSIVIITACAALNNPRNEQCPPATVAPLVPPWRRGHQQPHVLPSLPDTVDLINGSLSHLIARGFRQTCKLKAYSKPKRS